MKFAAIIAAVATVAATAHAESCPATEIPRLLALAQEPSLPDCVGATEYNFLPPSGIPTQAQLDTMCVTPACTSTLAALSAIAPSDCDTTFSNGVTLNVKSVLDLYTTNCVRKACPANEIPRLLALAQEPSLPACVSATGYDFLPPSGLPTQAQLDTMCATPACASTLAALSAIAPSDCDTTFSNGVTLNVKSVLDSATANCAPKTCPATEIPRLLELAQEPSLPGCEAESGFNFLPPSGVPSQEQLDLMCLSENCPATLAALAKIAPSDCDTTFSNGVTLNVKSVLDLATANCGFRRRSLRN